MEETVRALSAGDRVCNYEILGLAGVGGMGFVYKARDTKLERTVALKLLPPHLTFSEKDRRRLLQEAKSASALDHQNIGVIHGIEETTEGQTFIVMAFYEGTNLADRIAKSPIPIREAIDFSCQIAEGLSEAHRHSIIHRDIKPSNIIITKQSIVKIVDFGLALLLSDLAATLSLGIAGTAVYMAPEQVQRVPADQRSDIWALGVVLAEMLLGRHPFLRGNFDATMYAILNEPPEPLGGMPRELQIIIYRALAKNPAKRYQACPELLSDLERLRSRLPEVGADQADALLPTESISTKEVKRYAEQASAPAGRTGDKPHKLRRWLQLTG